MKKTDQQLMREALKAVKTATGIEFSEVSSNKIRRIMIELAEDGAWIQYEGDGCFDGVHIDEMNDRLIARILIRDYAA